MPDPETRLPGRGAWVHETHDCWEAAVRPPRLQPGPPGAGDHPSRDRRLHSHMAKKRVHELAKQYNMPTAEVMKRLNAAGIAVKAAASAVDETLADAALTGKKVPTNGAKPKPPQRAQLRPAGDLGIRDLGARPPEGMKPKPKPSRRPSPATAMRPAESRGNGDSRRNDGPRRPTRSSLQGERAPGSAGGVRRVVIDSQASRRQGGPGGPGGPGGGPGGGPQRRPPRRGGRRRRGTYTEPVPQDVSVLQAGRHQGQLRLDGQGRRGVPRRRHPRRHQEADAAGRDGHAHPDADRRRHPGARGRVRQEDRDRPRRRRAGRRADVRRRRRGPRAARARRHDHGPRRPRQDVAARRDPRDRGGRGRGRRHHPAHRRLPGPHGERQGHHLPRHAGPRGLHGDARPRRPGHRHRGDRGRGRRRREAADARGGRPRQGGRGADPRRGQQDRQGGRAARPRAHRDDAARPPAGGVGRRDDVRRRLREGAGRTSTTCSSRSCCWPRSRSSRPTRTPRRRAWSSSPSSTRAAARS